MANLNQTVLFVDDEVNILKSIMREMRKESFNSIFAASGMEALSILEKNSVDLIVSDIKMPEMDGLELLRRVKDEFPDVNRAVLSGYVEQESVLKSILQGLATTYFAKPWDKKSLSDGISNILKRRKKLSSSSLLNDIKSIESIPPPPETLKQFMSAIDQEKSYKELAAIIEKDLIISAKILQVVNSAFYGTNQISSVLRAIMILGVSTIKEILFAVSLGENPNWTASERKVYDDILLHSFLVSKYTNYFYKRKTGYQMDKKFNSVAITHDLGKIVQLLYFNEKISEINQLKMRNPVFSYYDCELFIDELETTHCELGAYFLGKWNFPDVSIEVALYHHLPEEASVVYKELVEVVAYTNNFVNYLLENKDVEYLEEFVTETVGEDVLKKIGNKIIKELDGE